MRRLVALLVILAAGCGGSAPPQAQPAQPSPPTPADGEPMASVSVPEAEPGEDTPEDEGPVGIADSLLAGEGWPMFHGDASRTGHSPASAILKPRIAWKAKVGIQGWLNSPVVAGEVVFVPSSGKAHNQPDPADGVYAFELLTGKLRWHRKLPQDANGAAIAGERVYVTCDDGYLYSLDAKTGGVMKKHAGQGKLYTHPLIVNEQVVVGDETGYVRGIDLSKEREAWSVQLTGSIRGGAASDGDSIFVASQGGEVAALSMEGKPRWRKAVERPAWGGGSPDVAIEAYSVPVISGDLVVIPFARDTYYKDVPALLALDKKTGRERWRARGPGSWGNVRTTPALIDGRLVYAEPYSGDIVGISARRGTLAFRKTVGACFFPQWASPAAAGDVVYVPRFGGVLYAVRANDGRLLWELYLGEAARAGTQVPRQLSATQGCSWDVPVGSALYSPVAVAANGTLLVGSHEGYLYAITQGR